MNFRHVHTALNYRDVDFEHLPNDEAGSNIQIVGTVILHCDVMNIQLFEAMDNPGPILNFFSELGWLQR